MSLIFAISKVTFFSQQKRFDRSYELVYNNIKITKRPLRILRCGMLLENIATIRTGIVTTRKKADKNASAIHKYKM